MEFRKIVMMTLYVRQQKRYRCTEQSCGLCGRGWVWDDLGEWHWNMYIIICEMDPQVWCLGQGAQGWCTGMTQRVGMGREVGGEFRMGNSCTHVVDSCQCMAKPLKYCKLISFQLKWIILLKNKVFLKYSVKSWFHNISWVLKIKSYLELG